MPAGSCEQRQGHASRHAGRIAEVWCHDLPAAVASARLERRGLEGGAGLPGREHRLRVGILDPAVDHQHRPARAAIERLVEGQFECVPGGHADEAGIGRAGRRGLPVGGGHARGDVLSAVVHGARGQAFLAEEDRRAGGRRASDRLALVERHLPPGWQVVAHELELVEVGDFLHGFADNEPVAAIRRRERALWQQHVLLRIGRAVDAWRLEEADAADTENVGDEPRRRAVEGEEHRTTRELTLRFLDDVQTARREVEFRLQHAVGPDERDEIGARRAAETDGHRLQALAAAGLQAHRVEHRPAGTGAHRDFRADARDVRAPLIARLRAAGGSDGGKKVPAATRRPRRRGRRRSGRRPTGRGRHRASPPSSSRSRCRRRPGPGPSRWPVPRRPPRPADATSTSNAPSPSMSAMASCGRCAASRHERRQSDSPAPRRPHQGPSVRVRARSSCRVPAVRCRRGPQPSRRRLERP